MKIKWQWRMIQCRSINIVYPVFDKNQMKVYCIHVTWSETYSKEGLVFPICFWKESFSCCWTRRRNRGGWCISSLINPLMLKCSSWDCRLDLCVNNFGEMFQAKSYLEKHLKEKYSSDKYQQLSFKYFLIWFLISKLLTKIARLLLVAASINGLRGGGGVFYHRRSWPGHQSTYTYHG